MRSAKLTLLGLLFGIIMMSCEHRELVDPIENHYLRIYIDENIRNVTYGFYDETRDRPEHVRPLMLRVAFADPVTGEVIADAYLREQGEDERGYYIHGNVFVPDGEYNMMVYNFGTNNAQVRDEYNYYDIEAYTNFMSSRYYNFIPQMRTQLGKETPVHEPEHFYLSTEEAIKVKRKFNQVDTLRTANGDYFTATSIVKSYYLQVRVKGIRWASSAASLLTGMAGSVRLHDGNLNEDDPVNLYFMMTHTGLKQRSAGDDVILYTTFNTFGKLPDTPSLYTLSMEFTKSDGSSQVEMVDITELFNSPIVKEKQWILLENEIVITPPEGPGGGMTPGVDEWNEINEEIHL